MIQDLLHTLTSNSLKEKLFKEDIFYRESSEDLLNTLNGRFEGFYKNYTSLVFKPDAIVSRKVLHGIELLKERGFIPVAFSLLRFNKHMIREVWKYQFNAASRDRLDLFDRLLVSSDCILIVLNYEGKKTIENASEFLTTLKGCSSLKERKPEHLRYQLGWVNVMLNYIHVPDEPADFVRELGIFFSGKTLDGILNESLAKKDVGPALKQFVEQVYSENPYHDLSFKNSLRRIQYTCETVLDSVKDPEQIKQIKTLIEACRSLLEEENKDWRKFIEQVNKAQIRADKWDLITIISELATINLSGATALL